MESRQTGQLAGRIPLKGISFDTQKRYGEIQYGGRREKRRHPCAIRLFPLYSHCLGSLADLSLELESSVFRPGVPRVSLSFESRINARSVRTENRTERRRSGIKGNLILRICIPSFPSCPSHFFSLCTLVVFLIKIHLVAPAPPTKRGKCSRRAIIALRKWDSRHMILLAGETRYGTMGKKNESHKKRGKL